MCYIKLSGNKYPTSKTRHFTYPTSLTIMSKRTGVSPLNRRGRTNFRNLVLKTRVHIVIHVNGVRLYLWTATTNGLLFICPTYERGEPRWNDTDRENRRTRRETCPSGILSTTNHTWTDLGANPGLRSERPATNRLSYGVANVEIKKQNKYVKLSSGYFTSMPFSAQNVRAYRWRACWFIRFHIRKYWTDFGGTWHWVVYSRICWTLFISVHIRVI
jgi:hypothetical protein